MRRDPYGELLQKEIQLEMLKTDEIREQLFAFEDADHLGAMYADFLKTAEQLSKHLNRLDRLQTLWAIWNAFYYAQPYNKERRNSDEG